MTDSTQAPPEDDTDHGLERLVFFSDAVFAIALTLLALELPVPEGSSNSELWHSFVNHFEWDYLNFLISFFVISRFWMVHHSYFKRVRAADHRVIQLNLLYLMGIVLLPFATRVLGDEGQYAFGTVVYAAAVAFVGLTFAALAAHCSRAGLLRESAPDQAPGGAVIGSVAVAAVFLLSIPIAFWSPDAAKFFWLTLVLTGPLLSRWTARRAARRDT